MLKSIALALTLALAPAAPVLAKKPAPAAAKKTTPVAAAKAAPAAVAKPAAVAAPTKPAYSTAETTIGVLLEDAAAKAILDKHIPGLTDNPSISMTSGMTLKALQSMTGDKLTDTMLAAVDADFKAMPSGK